MKRTLDRRRLLRGALCGAGVGIGLPALDAMLNRNGNAFADGAALPRRYGVWFFAGGFPQGWDRMATGALNPTGVLTPLAKYAPRLTVVSGLNCPSFGDFSTNRHIMGTAGGLSGAAPRGGAFSAKSIDQVVADALPTNPLRSLHVGVYSGKTAEVGTGWDWISHTGANSPNPALFSPAPVYASLFGGGAPAPAPVPGKPAVNTAALDKSYLDAVLADANDLKAQLGAADRMRLDSFLNGLKEIEAGIAGAGGGATGTPGAPAAPVMGCVAPADANMATNNSATVNGLMGKIVAAALACRKTQVFTCQFTRPNAFVAYPGMPDSHHNLGHSPQNARITDSSTYTMARFADFLAPFDAITEGSGTLLDQCAILVQSDTAWDHALNSMVGIVAGKAGGALKGGLHVRASGTSTRLGLTLGRACGANLTSVGTSDGMAKDSIADILV